MLLGVKEQGFKPDIIVGHSWGGSLFVKEVFPDVPYLAYIEWYYNYENSDVDFINKNIDINQKVELVCKNSHILQDLVRCDYALSPTNWQKQQVPDIFKDKIKVIHEGIDTNYCKPNEDAIFKVPNSDITLTRKDKILTYATRGMEQYRGFPEFMQAASVLMKEIPDLKVVVAGEDRVCYGARLLNTTFKTEMLKKYEYDKDRLFFVGALPYKDYVNLLQVSTAHIYLTYPFVLSWSLMEAMSIGCVIVASNTPPVKELIQDSYNGMLVDFSDTDKLIENAKNVILNRDKYKNISQNARQTIIENYEIKNMISKQLEYINSCIKK